jgi:hypothetical protein
MSLADDIAKMVEQGADEGVVAFAHLVAEEAKKLMPVGDPQYDPDPNVSMRDNIDVQVIPNQFGALVRITVDTPYAAKAHEDLRLKHPRGGGPKFLEHAMTALAPTMGNVGGSRVDAETATGKLSDPRRSRRRR